MLAHRRHEGPLVVQKALWPEGEAVCHTIVVHPPGGIAGGDRLNIDCAVQGRAHAVLTTPGATRWYRSTGPRASQQVSIDIDDGGALEWLPQETIVFDRARADMRFDVRLHGNAMFVGWEILCLGRTLSGESFNEGLIATSTSITRDDQSLWIERGRITGGDPLLASPVGFAGCTVSGTMLIAAQGMDDTLLSACRGTDPTHGRAGVTRLPGLLVARYLGDRPEAARHYFIRLWEIVRPAVLGRAAVRPRIWAT